MKNTVYIIFSLYLCLFIAGTERCQAGKPSLKYLGNAFVKIKTSVGKIIYIDPYAVNQTDSADVVLITHEHSDHNELTRVVQKASCQVIRNVNAQIGGVYQNFIIGDIKVQAVAAYNAYHAKSDGVGFVVEFDSIKIYHAGGTGNIPEMVDLASMHITYALYPMTPGPELMTQAAASVQAKHNIPIHTIISTSSAYDSALVARFTSPSKLVMLPDETIELINNPDTHTGQTLRVPQDYSTIQGAINAAQNSDTVLVSEGTYFENIKYNGKGIVVTSNYYKTKNWQTVFNTIIDGSTSLNKDTASTVQFLWREDSTAVLDGFTIRGGTGTKYMFPYGTGTYAYQEGAGIILHYSSAVIRNNFITNNVMTPIGSTANGGGGGIASMYGNPNIYNNIIVNNTSGYAGGIVLNWSGGRIKNNILYHNTATGPFGGGGLMVWKVSANTAYVENNTIVNNNSSAANGGGVILNLLDSSSIPVIKNNIVWNNTQASGAQFTLAQYGTYNDVQDYSGGTNISIDPQFLSGNNFVLSSSSPCIDAGDTSLVCNDMEDPGNLGHALTPSQGILRNDIGSYGGPAAIMLPEFSTVDVRDHKSLNYNFKLLQNYPNPFNPSTTIHFQMPISGHVNLQVFDVLGRELVTLVNEHKNTGSYYVQWNASDMPSGVYFYRLITDNFIETKKMLLTK
jgi:hypothetical protein